MSREIPVTAARLDPEPAGWLGALAYTGPQRYAALARLHELLVRITRGEVARRGPQLQMTGPELDDLASQAAAAPAAAAPGYSRYEGERSGDKMHQWGNPSSSAAKHQ